MAKNQQKSGGNQLFASVCHGGRRSLFPWDKAYQRGHRSDSKKNVRSLSQLAFHQGAFFYRDDGSVANIQVGKGGGGQKGLSANAG